MGFLHYGNILKPHIEIRGVWIEWIEFLKKWAKNK
jgi:hypothetical protein